jgi:hypothetical protein
MSRPGPRQEQYRQTGLYVGRRYHPIPPLPQDTILRLVAHYETDPSFEGVKPNDLYFHERHYRAFGQHLNELIERGLLERVVRPPQKWSTGRRHNYWYRLTPAGRAYIDSVSPAEAIRRRPPRR